MVIGTVRREAIGSRPGAPEDADWRRALADAITEPAELGRLLGLPPSVWEGAGRAGGFRLLVPRTFLARMRPGNPEDPLLLQVLPQLAEAISPPSYSSDPVGDTHATQEPGLLWKYPGRFLIVTTGACAVHCRFCFRRHFPYHVVPSWVDHCEATLRRIATEPSAREVILSGGDPLMVDDGRLARFVSRLSQIPQLARLRIHTRLPVVIPQRVTQEMFGWLRSTRLTPLVVMHVNHPAEIDDAVAAAFARLIDAGIPLLSQSVLLKGVNDRLETLVELFERLIDLRVIPYYLHQLDRVAGAAHFEVPETSGIELIQQLRNRLPGYAVPRYVRETPGGRCKQVLA